MPTHPVSVTVNNPDGCPCPTCPPPPPLPCPDCGGGFPLSPSVFTVPPAFEQHTFSSAYGVMTLEGDLVFRLAGRDPADFDAMYPNPEFGGDLRANDAYSLVRTVVGTSVGWSLQGPGGQAPILNFVSAAHLPGGAAANDGQAVHLRLVWDSAAGTVTGYVTYPGQPEKMVGRLTGQWTPYQSAACLHTWYLGGGRYIGGGDLAAENAAESCGGGSVMMAPPAPEGAPAKTVYERPQLEDLPRGLPGTEAARLIKASGLGGMEGCGGCMDMILRMNAWGVDGCRVPANEAKILARLRSRAKAVGWAAKLRAGLKLAVAEGLVLDPRDPAAGILAEAVRRCGPSAV